METIKQTSAEILVCQACNYETSNKKDFAKHSSTKKHLKMTLPSQPMETSENMIHKCTNCNKEYKHISSLSKHKKICGVVQPELPVVPPTQSEVIEKIEPLENEEVVEQPKPNPYQNMKKIVLETEDSDLPKGEETTLTVTYDEFIQMFINQYNENRELRRLVNDQNKIIEIIKASISF